ncbi:glutathione S-transferase family protein [Polynucleobacter sp. AP-Melu-500A-A1]|uniref:glutathione S-transferase family protein n=1 Tax=Polynucleobacter sp. AP-Melu-500A-A1 TaxID=2576929 RepID=UPI001C0E393B|nr:glutathione S-transferase family protein [Polynucleobacter sp. AP-Melu-500A-A1]MBU3629673.1 glutathione S-transferase family protein [Polynucleobacter sp. AP-Melu-500A-A1]
MILYSAPSSYYSMISRLALNTAQVSFENHYMDIHVRKDQLAPWYIALNPHMTVPTLVDGKIILIDSQDILHLAASLAGNQWLDVDVNLASPIESIVKAHYAIPIERLTFCKAMMHLPILKYIFPHALGSIMKGLEARLASAKDSAALQAKIDLNQSRITYFTQGASLQAKMAVERKRVSAYLNQLPTPNHFLFGDKPSSADIVTAVLLGRLKMIGEYALVTNNARGAVLDQWFSRMQQETAFQQSDIWLRFQWWRILLKR